MSEPGAGGEYLLGNRRPGAHARLAAIAELFDAATFRRLRAVGIAPGWHCWEVGAGGPSVPAWMAGQVGPSGRVLATDLDVAWLAPGGPFEVLAHDVGRDAPPGGRFDVVHARLVLVHVPGRDAALRSMAQTVRPGGWLVVEDADPELQPLACPDERGPEERRANDIRRAFRGLLAERGADLAFGRSLPRRLRALGLVDVQAEVAFPLTSPASAVVEETTVRQLRDDLLAAGAFAEQDVAAHLEAVAAGRLDVATAPMVTAWGRRP
jgi:SAM-dependent methyltransferase